MSYFRTSSKALLKAARMGSYEELAAFLVLARHANGRPPPGVAPYRFSGAGVNAVHEKAGLSEEKARGAVQRLQEAGLIRAALPEHRKLSHSARWEILQDELDLDLPHYLIDSSGDFTSALKRIRGLEISSWRVHKAVANMSSSELHLDVLVTLLRVYQRTSMSQFGGLLPSCCHREWHVISQSPKPPGVRWGAEPAEELWAAPAFMDECIHQRDTESDEGSRKQRFLQAWEELERVGLIYEAVSLFDTDPVNYSDAKIRCTLRVNDYHAATGDTGDPSLLAQLATHSESSLAFYTHPRNLSLGGEAMWVVLPGDTGFLIGIWRPRFRASNSDAGQWIETDSANVQTYFRRLSNGS